MKMAEGGKPPAGHKFISHGPQNFPGATIHGDPQVGDRHYHGVDNDDKRLKQLKVKEEVPVQNTDHFGTKKTIALLLSGWDKNLIEAFRHNQEQVKDMLIKHFDISKDNIHTVEYETGGVKTRSRLQEKIEEVKELMKKEHGNFLFYYLGHNNKTGKKFLLNQGKIDDNYIKHEELKTYFKQIEATSKFIIIDTCHSGDAALPDHKEDENWFPLLWDDEKDSNILQWRSSHKDEASFFDAKKRMGHFTAAIQHVLSSHTCENRSCRDLRQNVQGVDNPTFVSISQLHPCVCDHVDNQQPNWKFSGEDGTVPLFPLIAQLC